MKPPACLALALAAGASIPAIAAPQWLEGRAAVGDATRDYRLYVPDGASDPAPLVVMLHGCGQNPEVFAESTRMNRVADGGRFMVLYPAQRITANPARCWNWFLPKNQGRGGEPAEIVALVEYVAARYLVDRKRIYVAGLSAGASMSATLAACYPEVFAAAAMASGTMYRSADSLTSAGRTMARGEAADAGHLADAAWACGGKRPLAVPVAVWHGTADKVVVPVNGANVLRQFARLNDWADDGRANGSAGATDPQTHEGRVPGGHAYAVATYLHRGKPLLEYTQVQAMGHAWSGGKDELPFSDGKGPDASAAIWQFFRRHSR